MIPDDLPRLRTLLFDLDGTLLDTAPDLAEALNQVLREEGRPPRTHDEIRPVVSHGAGTMIRFGFGIEPAHPDFERLRQSLLDHYRANLAVHTRLFPGMAELLGAVEARGMNWGVVTNKPGWLTDPLLHSLNLFQRAACVVSGDTTPQRKPHPAPMLYACRMAGSDAAECLYVGDAQRDIEAGRHAGMHTLVALFGYLGEDDVPHAWGADGLVTHPAEILDWIDRLNGRQHTT